MTKRSIASLVSALICLALLNGCSSNKQKPQEITEPTEESVRFEISAFSDIPSSEQEDWAAALSAFKISCRSIYRKTAWAEACSKASGTDAQNAEAFFKNNFTPWKIEKRTIGTQTGTVYSVSDTGLMTGYYEPLLTVSKHRTERHTTPILSTPDDLIIVDLAEAYPKLKGMRLRGKIQGRKLVPYDTRAKIVARKDLDKYSIAWSDDPVAVFFLQIQGSGRLRTEEGELIRVGYDDQNGRPYKAVGSWLVDQGYLKRHELSMQNIRAWAQNNPDKVDTLLNQNQSFVFLKKRKAEIRTRDRSAPKAFP